MFLERASTSRIHTLPFFAVCLVALHAAPPALAGDSPPNVVVMVWDDVGTDFLAPFDELNPYTGDVPDNGPGTSNLYVHAPNLESLASEGVKFVNAYAQPLCSPSRAALLTGQHALRTGVGDIFRDDNVGGLLELGDGDWDYPTLPEVLDAAGYRSGIVGKWHLGMPTPDMDPKNGLDCYSGWASIPDLGHFDEWACVFNGVDTEPVAEDVPPWDAGFYNFYFCRNVTDQSQVDQVVGQYATVVQMAEAAAWCNTAQEPFFCLVTPNASHSPWHDLPPSQLVTTDEYDTDTKNCFTHYCATLEALDAELGTFRQDFDDIREANTWIIIIGDNGTPEIVLDHARLRGRINPGPGGPTVGSAKDLGATYDFLLGSLETGDGRFKSTVYEKGVRVPMVVKGPGLVDPGRTSRALVQIEDIFPTVAELAAVPAGDVQGISFVPLLENTADETTHARDYVWSQRFNPIGHAGANTDHDLHRIGCSLRIPSQGRFKIVRDVLAASDQFYQLEDAAGAFVDPWELAPLDLGAGSPWLDEYAAVSTRIALLMSGATDGPTCTVGTTFCTPLDNSTGGPALISSEGTTHLDCDDFVLLAKGAPPNQNARFFYSQSTLPETPLGDGNLCMSQIVRLDIISVSKDGEAVFPLDFGALPANGQIAPNSTWHFQFWYRDPAAGGAGFNLSDALTVTFCP